MPLRTAISFAGRLALIAAALTTSTAPALARATRHPDSPEQDRLGAQPSAHHASSPWSPLHPLARRGLLEQRDLIGPADTIELATINATLAHEAMSRALALHDDWMPHRHPATGLFGRTQDGSLWTYRDVAADFFAHQLNTALCTDAPSLNALLDTLRAERAGNVPGRLCRTLDVQTGQGVRTVPQERLFGTTEYIKDGLLPLLELHDHPHVRARIVELADVVVARSAHPSRFGPVPDGRSEVNGEVLQAFARLHFTTAKPEYAELVAAITDATIEQMLPANNGLPAKEFDFENDQVVRPVVQLRDHGNEVLVGLGEAFAMAAHLGSQAAHSPDDSDDQAEAAPAPSNPAVWRDRADRWAEPLAEIYLTVLDKGRNPDGLLVNRLDAQSLTALDPAPCDNWGYILCGAAAFVQAAVRHNLIDTDRSARIEQLIFEIASAVARTDGHRWQNDHQDGFADSIESAIYVLAYCPPVDAPSLTRWIDSQMARMYEHQQPDGSVDRHYLDGNFMRTAILYAQFRSGGWRPHLWSPSVGLGLESSDDKSAVLVVRADSRGWLGVVTPDAPRHTEIMNLPWNWPRINSWPEWCTHNQITDIQVLHGGDHVTLPPDRDWKRGIALDLPPNGRAALLVRRATTQRDQP